MTEIIKLESKHILHSVLEIKDKDSKKIKIIDLTRNLVIDKDFYLKIFEFHILEEIESKNILENFELLSKYGLLKMSEKINFAFRSDIIRDL